MRKRTHYFVYGALWLCLTALQAYHLHTGEVGWAWSTVLGLFVYVLGTCYFLAVGVRKTDRASDSNDSGSPAEK